MRNHLTPAGIRERLEYLRTQLRGECISYGELVELQDLALHIDPHDTELLEAAGVPENHAEVVSCNQCQMLSINGTPCHETGCPNEGKRWEDGEWVRYVECFECGFDVRAGEACDCQTEED